MSSTPRRSASDRQQPAVWSILTVLLVGLAVPCTDAVAQAGPFSKPAQISGVLSTAAKVGSDFFVEVRVDLRGVTGFNSGDSVPAVLGSYVIAVGFDNARLAFVSAAGGTSQQFASDPTATGASTANANGSVLINAAQTNSSAPTGLVSVARLKFKALFAGTTSLDLNATSLSSALQSGAGPASIPDTPGTLSLTAGNPPGPVTYVAPADDATDLASPVLLQWNPATGATEYRIYLGTSSTPSKVAETTGNSYNATVQPGKTYQWKVVAANDWGETSGPPRSFSTKGNCASPQAPTLSLTEEAACGSGFTVSWSPDPNATGFDLEESLTADFTTVTTQHVTGTSRSLEHRVCESTRFFYRVRAVHTSPGCQLASSWSAPRSILVTSQAVVPEPDVDLLYVPVVTRVIGFGGTLFRTEAQLHNPTGSTIDGRLRFHPARVSGANGVVSIPYSIGPYQTLYIPDVVNALQTTDFGSLDIVAETLPAPIASFRVFSDMGAAGTKGLTQFAMGASEALHTGEEGILIGSPNSALARLNIGIRTLGEGAALAITVYDSTGAVVQAVGKTYPADFFVQQSASDFLGFDPPDGSSIRFVMNGGSALIYGAITDNITQDPSMQMVRRVPR